MFTDKIDILFEPSPRIELRSMDYETIVIATILRGPVHLGDWSDSNRRKQAPQTCA